MQQEHKSVNECVVAISELCTNCESGNTDSHITVYETDLSLELEIVVMGGSTKGSF